MRRIKIKTAELAIGAVFYNSDSASRPNRVLAQGPEYYVYEYDCEVITEEHSDDVWIDAPITVGSLSVGERFVWCKDAYRVTAVGVRTSLVIRETGKDAQFELALWHDLEVEEVSDGE